MLTKKQVLRLAAAFALCAWCLLFARTRSTERTMVRAVLLERGAQGWTVGCLYQTPEASADAGEASAQAGFAAAEGATLPQALSAAERAMPYAANYRLCDYVLLCSSGGGALLDEYEAEILSGQRGRLSARVVRGAFTCVALSAASEEIETLPQALLQTVKQAGEDAPRLYDRAAGLLLPVLELTDSGAARREEAVLCAEGQELTLTPNQTQAALLLVGKGETHVFSLDGARVELGFALCSLTARQDGFALRADCLPAPGVLPPTEAQTRELAALLESTAALLWENGVDALGLAAAQQAKNLPADAAKNACPEIQADVKIYDWFS